MKKKDPKEKDPKEYTVTAQGSLGLLALGHVGVRAWREAMTKEKQTEKEKKKSKGSQKKKNEN